MDRVSLIVASPSDEAPAFSHHMGLVQLADDLWLEPPESPRPGAAAASEASLAYWTWLASCCVRVLTPTSAGRG